LKNEIISQSGLDIVKTNLILILLNVICVYGALSWLKEVTGLILCRKILY